MFQGYCVRFSRFALTYSFLAVLGRVHPFFMFCAPQIILVVWWSLCSVFKFNNFKLIFDGSGAIVSDFHILCSRTRWQFLGPYVQFSSFALLDSFSTIPEALCPFSRFSLHNSFLTMSLRAYYRFCDSRLIFDYFEVVGGPTFTFCAPTLVFDG
jgi:hypothetical protein